MKPFTRIVIFIISVLMISSFSASCKYDSGHDVKLKDVEKKAKKLLVGEWALVGTQCASSGVCYKKVSVNVENITFGKEGMYRIGKKSYLYRIKDDFLYMDYNDTQCKFKYVFLDDNTLLYGTFSNLQKFVRVK